MLELHAHDKALMGGVAHLELHELLADRLEPSASAVRKSFVCGILMVIDNEVENVASPHIAPSPAPAKDLRF